MSHYCYKCGCQLANEKFNGKGHARHVCHECWLDERAFRLREELGFPANEPPKPLSPEVIDYVEAEILPRYAAFDKAHQEDHIRSVIERSLKFAEHNSGMNLDMVYLIAAFHDLGMVNGRENHHKDSRKLLEADPFIKSHFKQKQIVIMGQAVEDHRASSGKRPRSGYGMIVAEADRLIEPELIIRRTIQYSLSHFPELDKNGHFQRCHDHLIEKYGPKGYLKVWLPWSDNAQRLKELHRILNDQSQLLDLFNRIFEEETNGHSRF